jgi:hypothetical protein
VSSIGNFYLTDLEIRIFSLNLPYDLKQLLNEFASIFAMEVQYKINHRRLIFLVFTEQYCSLLMEDITQQ